MQEKELEFKNYKEKQAYYKNGDNRISADFS